MMKSKIFIYLSSLWAGLLVMEVRCNGRSVEELSNVVDSHTETFSQIFSYMRRIEKFWDWFLTHERELSSFLETREENLDSERRVNQIEKKLLHLEQQLGRDVNTSLLPAELSSIQFTLQKLIEHYQQLNKSLTSDQNERNRLTEELDFLKKRVANKEFVRSTGDSIFRSDLNLKGQPGLPGFKGDYGPPGPPGPPGFNGDYGPPGLSGPPGSTGSRGIPGLQGFKGDKGTPGLPGQAGVQGLLGLTGEKGDGGTRGLPGLAGVPGLQGLPGLAGVPGLQGLPGEKGDKGTPGPKGDIGSPSAIGMKGLKGEPLIGFSALQHI